MSVTFFDPYACMMHSTIPTNPVPRSEAVQLYRSREILQLVGDPIEQDQIRESASMEKCMRMYAHKTIAWSSLY